MKDYIVFLASGESVYGTMSDTEAARLRQAFIDKAPGVLEFSDTQGALLLETGSIMALALNNVGSNQQVGFIDRAGSPKEEEPGAQSVDSEAH